jgi:hypothetical protein
MSVVSGSSREAGTVVEPPGPPTSAPVGGGGARVVGVDVARGLALLGMIAVHIFDTLHGNNTPSKTQQVLAGHALATFVLLAGVSLTFITKRSRTGSLLLDAAVLTTRALIILLIGFGAELRSGSRHRCDTPLLRPDVPAGDPAAPPQLARRDRDQHRVGRSRPADRARQLHHEPSRP